MIVSYSFARCYWLGKLLRVHDIFLYYFLQFPVNLKLSHIKNLIQSVQFSHSVVSDSLRLHESHARPPCPSLNSQRSLKLMSIESVMPSSHLILYCPLLLLPPIPPSIRVFSNESTLRMRWPKYWSFSFSISPSREHPGLISFRKVTKRDVKEQNSNLFAWYEWSVVICFLPIFNICLLFWPLIQLPTQQSSHY